MTFRLGDAKFETIILRLCALQVTSRAFRGAYISMLHKLIDDFVKGWCRDTLALSKQSPLSKGGLITTPYIIGLWKVNLIGYLTLFLGF